MRPATGGQRKLQLALVGHPLQLHLDPIAGQDGLLKLDHLGAQERRRNAEGLLPQGDHPVQLCYAGPDGRAREVAVEHAQPGVDQQAGRGLARAINPVHTMSDGDTLFTLATGVREQHPGMLVLATMAAEAVARATVRAVLTARALHLNDGLRLPCHADMVSTGG